MEVTLNQKLKLDEGQATVNMYISPFDVFPHEVWENVVIKILVNPEGLWKLITAFPELRQEVIIKQEVLFYKVLPLVFPDLEKKDVLTCRAVCNSWHYIVDNFIANHSSVQAATLIKTEVGYRYSSLHEKEMTFMVKCTPSQIKEKLNILGICRDSGRELPRLVGKSISFENDNQDVVNMDSFYQSVETLLKSFGGQVEHVCFPLAEPVQGTNFQRIPNYPDLVRCLGLVPNVKSLELFTPVTRPVFCSARTSQILQIWATNPLPKLPFLKCLRVCMQSFHEQFRNPLELVVTHTLATYQAQLEKVTIDPYFWDSQAGTRLPSLRHLNLGHITSDSIDTLTNLLEGVNPELLKEIGLLGIRVPLAEIFLFLQAFGIQPESLVLSRCLSRLYPNSRKNVLPVLLSVKALTISKSNYTVSNDSPQNGPFFPPMLEIVRMFPNLVRLEINLEKTTEIDEIGMKKLLRGKFERVQGQEHLDEDIWTWLSDLKVLIVGKKRMAREIYNRN